MQEPYLTHNDDGKGKWQSHTVSFNDTSCHLPYVDGYGSTKEEAFEDFKTNLNKRLEELTDFCNKVNAYQFNAASNPIVMYEVDWAGKILDE